MKPTGKQKRNADIYLRTLNKTEAGLGAYDTQSKAVAHNLTTRNLANPKVQQYIADVLDRVGLGDEQLGHDLKKIIKSSTTRRSLKKTTPADGLRGIELSYKLRDRFPAERKQIEQISLKLEGKTEKELQLLLDSTIKDAQKYKELLTNDKDKAIDSAPLEDSKDNKNKGNVEQVKSTPFSQPVSPQEETKQINRVTPAIL